MIEVVYTIGGYGHAKDGFFKKLESNGIDVLVDIRQRRGMRGKTYSFLNSRALQSELSERAVAYIHMKGLAPTNDIRDAQKEEDKRLREIKSSRAQLSERFKEQYRAKILAATDMHVILQELQAYRRPCFFCVEGPATACHRSIVTDWILERRAFSVVHITSI